VLEQVVLTVATVAEAFALALQHHQAGNLRQAEHLYQQILDIEPAFADAHHLLGVIAYQEGNYPEALDSIRHAIALNPRAAAYHSNLGVTLEAAGRQQQALASFQQALLLQPGSAEAHQGVGNAFRALGQLDQAAAHYAEAVRIKPEYPEALNNLANVLFLLQRFEEAVLYYEKVLRYKPEWTETQGNLANAMCRLGRWTEAVEHCRQALRLRPDDAAALSNLGNALRSLGMLDEAVAHCRQAIALRPDLVEAHHNLGTALAELGHADQATACFREVLRLKPDFAEGWSNLGNVLALEDQLEEAIGCYQQAIRFKPDFADVYGNLGYVRFLQGHFNDAQALYKQALQRDANHAETHFNQALLWLLHGKWAKGLQEYEWRWQTKDFPRYGFRQPLWDGSLPAHSGQTLLVLSEQGLGDTVQFVRYLPLLQVRGWRVILQCQPPLRRLLTALSGLDQLLPQGAPLPGFDEYVPLLSLPRIFGTKPSSAPAATPYLHADSNLVAHWQRQLENHGARSISAHVALRTQHPARLVRVGIAWQGNPTFRGDRQRSIPLKCFAPLAQIEGVQLISLQKGPGTDQLHDLGDQFPVVDLGTPLDDAAGAFMDTAAIMQNLDLVICSDTAIAHLAGALGIPVWVVLSLVPDWRWLLQREDSPWYPSMRVFRQTQYGRWDDVFQSIASEIKKVATDVASFFRWLP
jgi:tetratricopeptide (TPR) repeat protein